MLWSIYKKVIKPITISYLTTKNEFPSPLETQPPTKSENLMNEAYAHIKSENVNEAFSTLAQIYTIDPNTNGLQKAFESCLVLKINVTSSSFIDAGDISNIVGVVDNNLETLIEVMKDRLGLASLLIDQERYEEASYELHEIISSSSSSLQYNNNNNENDLSLSKVVEEIVTKSKVMLYRTSAASCDWEYNSNTTLSNELLTCILKQIDDVEVNNNHENKQTNTNYNLLHPFDALKWPFLNLENATSVARMYSKMARDHVISNDKDFTTSSNIIARKKKEGFNNNGSEIIKIGYISPDFTGNHPLAFLMQDVFQLHNKSKFIVNVYSLTSPDDSIEVNKIINGCNKFITLSPQMSSIDIAKSIQNDNLDVMIDLCSHAGTSKNAEIIAYRVAPIQISYMGFPASSGVDYLHDYLVCDSIVVPPVTSTKNPNIRKQYKENLIIMPHCYFVNSHRNAALDAIDNTKTKNNDNRKTEKIKYGLPTNGFVYCCHSRPDKIDNQIFRVWLNALTSIRQKGIKDNNPYLSNSVLWLLRSGTQMEHNLRKIALLEYGLNDDALIFAPIVPRIEHLQRLSLADIFCDTPIYNAHTLGCDALFLGVPMISLLDHDHDNNNDNNNNMIIDHNYPLDKLASRVGASLLTSVGLNNFIAPNLKEYEKLLVRCAVDKKWFYGIKIQLESSRFTNSSLLFDTERWVKNFEKGIIEACYRYYNDDSTTFDESGKDIFVIDDDDNDA